MPAQHRRTYGAIYEVMLASAFTLLPEQFPTALRGRGHFFGESSARLLAGVCFPLFLERYTASPLVFFGTLLVVVGVGSVVPLLLGWETVGQLETVTGAVTTEHVRLAA